MGEAISKSEIDGAVSCIAWLLLEGVEEQAMATEHGRGGECRRGFARARWGHQLAAIGKGAGVRLRARAASGGGEPPSGGVLVTLSAIGNPGRFCSGFSNRDLLHDGSGVLRAVLWGLGRWSCRIVGDAEVDVGG